MVSDFMASSLSVVNLQPCELNHMGHRPKMFLYMLDKLMYVYKGLGDDYNGQQIVTVEILSLMWKCYCQSKHLCQVKNLAHGHAMTQVHHGDYLWLERLAWAVFDGVLACTIPFLIIVLFVLPQYCILYHIT